jgi:hypothetical protein
MAVEKSASRKDARTAKEKHQALFLAVLASLRDPAFDFQP